MIIEYFQNGAKSFVAFIFWTIGFLSIPLLISIVAAALTPPAKRDNKGK